VKSAAGAVLVAAIVLTGSLARATPAASPVDFVARADAAYAAGRAALGRDPDAIQRSYELSRTLQEAIRHTTSSNVPCAQLIKNVARLADLDVAAAEELDRLHQSAASDRFGNADATHRLVLRDRRACDGHRLERMAPRDSPSLVDPQPGEAFFGYVRVKVPAGTRHVDVFVDGIRRSSDKVTTQRHGVIPIRSDPGAHAIVVEFRGAANRLLLRQLPLSAMSSSHRLGSRGA
jgi:hypothetical protein